MLNILRADFYRILRGKALYITLAVFLVLIAGESIAGAGTVGVITEDTFQNQTDEEVYERATGMDIPFLMAESTDNIVYFLLPFIICFAGADFSSHAVKNPISRGISRKKYYLAKLIPVLFFAVIIQLLNLAVPILTATIRNGFGGDFSSEWFAGVLKIYGSQLILIMALACIGVFITFVTRKTSAVIALFMALLLAPSLILTILGMISSRFETFINYDLLTNFKMLANFESLAAGEITRAILLGGFYIIASTAAGVFLFQKSDIK